MSSILKALKKIEESGQVEDPRNRTVAGESRAFLPLRRGKTWPPRRIAAYASASVLLLAAGVGTYSWWADDQTPSRTARQPEAVRAQLPPVPEGQPQTAPPLPPPQPPGTVKGPGQAAPSAKPGPQVQAPPPSTRIRPRDGTGTPASEARPVISQKTTPQQDRPAPIRPAQPKSSEDALSRLDESKLKVMAIAWSDKPQQRLAVVNGHIVKEGEAVEGYSITQIRKDDVIVNDGSRSWRVELNLKTQP